MSLMTTLKSLLSLTTLKKLSLVFDDCIQVSLLSLRQQTKCISNQENLLPLATQLQSLVQWEMQELVSLNQCTAHCNEGIESLSLRFV
jgi:hypothetical protein